MLHDPWNGCVTFGIVYVGRFTKHPIAGWERRFKARLAFLAFYGLYQRGFFTAYVGAVTVHGIQIKTKIRAK